MLTQNCPAEREGRLQHCRITYILLLREIRQCEALCSRFLLSIRRHLYRKDGEGRAQCLQVGSGSLSGGAVCVTVRLQDRVQERLSVQSTAGPVLQPHPSCWSLLLLGASLGEGHFCNLMPGELGGSDFCTSKKEE